MVAVVLALQVVTSLPIADPFAFFQPTAVITPDDRARLDRGEPVARTLPGQDMEVAVLAAVPVNIDGDRLIAWMRRIEEMKKSAYVTAIGRFSDPPRIEDLAALTLDDETVREIRSCRPGSCGLKLSASEMTELRDAAAATDGDASGIQNVFRRVMLARVLAYRSTGDVASYDDQASPVWPAIRFRAVLAHSLFLVQHEPVLTEHLRTYPTTVSPTVESFIYWSKEKVASKAIISMTHVNIVRGGAGRPDALVAGKEIFATHYVNASLGITALVRGGLGGPNYLVYINRSEVDVLHGMFAGLIRWVMQRRLKSEAANVLQGLRQRLESGEPPPVGAKGQYD